MIENSLFKKFYRAAISLGRPPLFCYQYLHALRILKLYSNELWPLVFSTDMVNQ